MKKIFSALIITILFGACSDEAKNQKPGIYANIETNKGEILLNLEYEKTPLTVANFIALAEGNHPSDKLNNEYKDINYYNGLIFHRVIPDFMIQTGDPLGLGSGGPGFTFPDEITDLKHSGPGILSMANRGPKTNGSQFFITHKATPWLDGKHTVFGNVIKGQKVVDSIIQNDTMISIKILRNGTKAKNFNAPKIFLNELKRINEQAEIKKQERIKKEKQILDSLTSKMIVTQSGLSYFIKNKGTGNKAKKGDLVSVHYRGMLLNGSVFDSSFERDQPIEFTLGMGQVIPGWDEGISLLKEGESAKLVIPSKLAYGEIGAGNGLIPPDSVLVFEVELIEIK